MNLKKKDKNSQIVSKDKIQTYDIYNKHTLKAHWQRKAENERMCKGLYE